MWVSICSLHWLITCVCHMVQPLSDISQVIMLIKIESCVVYTLYSDSKRLWYQINFKKDLPWIITKKYDNVSNIFLKSKLFVSIHIFRAILQECYIKTVLFACYLLTIIAIFTQSISPKFLNHSKGVIRTQSNIWDGPF